MTNSETLYTKTPYVADRTNMFEPVALKGKQKNLHAWESALLSARTSVKNVMVQDNFAGTMPHSTNFGVKNYQSGICCKPPLAESDASSPPVALVSGVNLSSQGPVVFAKPSISTTSFSVYSASTLTQPSLSQTVPISEPSVAPTIVAGVLVSATQYRSLVRTPVLHVLYTEDGADVYIRANMATDSEIGEFVSLIRRNLLTLSMPISTITVNGKKTFERPIQKNNNPIPTSSDQQDITVDHFV